MSVAAQTNPAFARSVIRVASAKMSVAPASVATDSSVVVESELEHPVARTMTDATAIAIPRTDFFFNE